MPRKDESIRWTKEKAASEFGLNIRTLTNRLRQSHFAAGEDGKYSTHDIHRALAGDLQSARARKETAIADREEMKAARESRQVAEVRFIERAWEQVAGLMKKRILLIPTRFESQFRSAMTQQEARKLIETEIDDALSELGKNMQYFSLEETAEDAVEAAPAAAETEDQ